MSEKGKNVGRGGIKGFLGFKILCLLFFKDEFEKVESLSYEKEFYRYRFIGVCLRYLLSKDGFYFCVVSMIQGVNV